MNNLLRLRQYLRPYLGAMAAGLMYALVVAGATAAVAALVKPMFNDVFYLGSVPGAAAAPSLPAVPPMAALPGAGALQGWQLWFRAQATWLFIDVLHYDPSRAYIIIPLLFVLTFLIKGLFTYLSSYRLGMVGLKVVKDLRSDLYESIQNQSLKFFSAHPTGLLISRVTNDVAVLQQVAGVQMAEMVRLGFSLVFLVTAALILDWRLSLICTVVLPATIYPVVRFAQKIKRSTHASQSRLADVADRLQETIIGRRVVRGFNTEAYEIDRFNTVLEGMMRADRRAMKYHSLTAPTIEFVGSMAMALLAAFAGWRIHAGTLNPGDFVATLAALYYIYAILKKFARFGNDLTRASAAADRVFSIIDLERDIAEAPGAVILPPFTREIRLRDAHFAYGGEPVLDGVNLTIAKGEKLALVGSSGAGKTTLVNLVARFYDVTAGSVEIDGVDIRQLTLRSLRDQIGLVTQEIVLFNDTVHNNIAYGRDGVPREAVEAAARAAHAHIFISALPEKYDTVLGEAANTLSTGQRQRIAIARALLKAAPILILDEATSALDTESEALVQEALVTLMQERTAIIIAHRLATVRAADRIVVLEQGRVAEVGSHDELLVQDGVYARFYRLQLAGGHPPSLEPGAHEAGS